MKTMPLKCLVASALFAGCASQTTQVRDGLIGKPESAVLAQYGTPNRTYSTHHGEKVLVYDRGASVDYTHAQKMKIGNTLWWTELGPPTKVTKHSLLFLLRGGQVVTWRTE